jgi:hypothetical protein
LTTDARTSSDGDGNDQSGIDDEVEEDNDMPVFKVEDEGYGYGRKELEREGGLTQAMSKKKKEKKKQESNNNTSKMAMEVKRAPHLWHAALALVLERGRPVTREFLLLLFDLIYFA